MKFPKVNLKKISLLFAALLLSFTLGSGMNKAFAGQGIQSLLTSWFDTKREASIGQIDQAITSEKNRLMAELKDAVSADIQRADAELAQFTEDEINLRTSQLQSYADELINGLNFNNPEEKAKIQTKLDSALVEAKSLLDNAVTVNPPSSPPNQGKDHTQNGTEEDDAQKEAVKPAVESKKPTNEQEAADQNNTKTPSTKNEVKDENSSSDKDNNMED